MDSNLLLLFGKARALVLEAFHRAAGSGEALHLRELARRTGLSPTGVQYELRLLRQLDLIQDIGTGTRPSYVLNREHGLYPDLRSLFTRSSGGLLHDDAHFQAKRTRQRADRGARSATGHSPFLRRRG